MTGSAFKRWTLYRESYSVSKGGSLRGVGSRSHFIGGWRINPGCLFRCLFPSCFRVVSWSVFSDMLAEVDAIWEASGRLFVTF